MVVSMTSRTEILNQADSAAHLVALGIPEDVADQLADHLKVVRTKADPVWSARSMLSRTLELVQTGWSQHEQARSRRGIGCEPSAAIARAWSLDGAINLAYAEAVDATLDGLDPTFHSGQCLAGRNRLVDALETHLETAGHYINELSYWNDTEGRTQVHVIELCQAVLAEQVCAPAGPCVVRS